MDIRASLTKEHSKQAAERIRDAVLQDCSLMGDLMNCFFDDDWVMNQRAAWPMCKIAIKKHELIYPYLPKMIDKLHDAKHDAIIRNTVRILQDIDIPEDLQGVVFEICFDYLLDVKRPTAIRAFSVKTLFNISKNFPELQEELISELEIQKETGTVGFKNRCRNTLYDLYKLKT